MTGSFRTRFRCQGVRVSSPMSDRFFSRDNLHRAGWSILVALVAFGAGSVYSRLRGQEKVVIATPDEGAKPLVVRIDRTPGDPGVPVPGVAELTDEIRRLRAENANVPPRARSGLEARRTGSSTFSPPFIPAFELPASVQGYSRKGLGAFGEASCPPEVVTKSGAILLQLYLEERVDVGALTPAFLRIDRPEGKNNSVQVLEQQYVLAKGLNSFRVPIDFPPGKYDLALGFYALAELKRPYPNFYSVECPMKVQ